MVILPGGVRDSDLSGDGEQAEARSRRTVAIMGLAVFAVFSVILGRLYGVQIRQRAEFIEKSKGNFVQFNRLEHARGEILDRDGRLLVSNRPSMKVEVTPAYFPKSSRIVGRLARAAGLSTKQTETVLAALLKAAEERGPPILLARELSRDDAAQLREAQQALDLPLPSLVILEMPPPSPPDRYAAYLDPEHFPTAARVIRRLAEDMGLTAGELETAKKRIARATGLDVYLPILIRRDVSPEIEERVARDVLLGDLAGVAVVATTSRHYVRGELAAHLLGYVNELSPAELEDRREDGYRLGDIVGRRGVEKAFEVNLRGVDGREAVVVDSKGRAQESSLASQLRDEIGEPELPRAGDRVFLSLDLDLQLAAERAFPGRAGAAVALEVATGRVLVMTSTPSFNPNLVTGFFDPREKKRLDENRALRPWRFRAIQDHFAPGSTFKVITALAALGKGVTTPTESIGCRGAFHLGATRFRCWKDSGHGPCDVVAALERSCDVYFYTMGTRLGLDPIAAVGFDLGLGRPTGIPLDGESPGIIPTAAWYKKHLPEGYTLGAAVNVSVGQGATTVTPLQLAVAYAALANGGTVFEPQVGLRIEPVDGSSPIDLPARPRRKLELPKEALDLVREGLRKVVNDPGGTAYRRRLADVEVSGKTGTAQVAKLVKRGHGEDIPWPLRDHAWFACFAPSKDPEIVVVVLNEHGGGGGSAAAPAAMQIVAAWHAKKTGRPIAPPPGTAPRLGDARGAAPEPLQIAVLTSGEEPSLLPLAPAIEGGGGDGAWLGR